MPSPSVSTRSIAGGLATDTTKSYAILIIQSFAIASAVKFAQTFEHLFLVPTIQIHIICCSARRAW